MDSPPEAAVACEMGMIAWLGVLDCVVSPLIDVVSTMITVADAARVVVEVETMVAGDTVEVDIRVFTDVDDCELSGGKEVGTILETTDDTAGVSHVLPAADELTSTVGEATCWLSGKS